MFQQVSGDLPPMSTEVLALRRDVWDAEGIHLIFNVPRPATGVVETAPLSPFAGLCVAFLIYLEKDKDQFCPMLGSLPHAYMIGWANKENWGLYSVTAVNKDGGHKGWLGHKDANHPGFAAGYYYVYFYFKNSNTLNGWINNLELNSDDQHPYDVSKVSTNVAYGYSGWHEALTLEAHWVVWGSAHNRGSSPSKSLKDQLFPKNDGGNETMGWSWN
ncbi:uncharacterized protein [Dermacentor albipictus]|uniref:uncharacterized protein isoform X2 n=1 Tax=Dermacentor albipictus TaxID=60249 RepID=UPI0038FCDCD1